MIDRSVVRFRKGKYKGWPVKDVPRHHLLWRLENDMIHGEERRAAIEAFERWLGGLKGAPPRIKGVFTAQELMDGVLRER
jgi:hypothetical protein